MKFISRFAASVFFVTLALLLSWAGAKAAPNNRVACLHRLNKVKTTLTSIKKTLRQGQKQLAIWNKKLLLARPRHQGVMRKHQQLKRKVALLQNRLNTTYLPCRVALQNRFQRLQTRIKKLPIVSAPYLAQIRQLEAKVKALQRQSNIFVKSCNKVKTKMMNMQFMA